jgi:hypothetical protein
MENIRHDKLGRTLTRMLIRQEWTTKERNNRAKMAKKKANQLFSMIGASDIAFDSKELVAL